MKRSLALLVVFLAVPIAFGDTAMCEDTDSGIAPLTPGVGIHWTQVGDQQAAKGGEWDECYVGTNTLREHSCHVSGLVSTHNIPCGDMNAVCVRVEDGPDFCACEEGTVFDEQSQACERFAEIPEFGYLGILALVGAVSGFVFIRAK